MANYLGEFINTITRGAYAWTLSQWWKLNKPNSKDASLQELVILATFSYKENKRDKTFSAL